LNSLAFKKDIYEFVVGGWIEELKLFSIENGEWTSKIKEIK
jgi:hypothetical protein